MKAFKLLVPLAMCAALGACSMFEDGLIPPGSEAPVDDSESYLSQGGPQTKVDLGGGEEQLLTRFQAVLDEKIQLQEREKELLAEIDALRKALGSSESDAENERRMRVGAEAEGERLRKIKNDRETKILHLHMQIAELERAKMQLEIAEIERQIELIDEQKLQAAPPAGGR